LNHNVKIERITSFFSPVMNEKARTSDEVREEEELTAAVTVSVSDSTGIQEQIDNDWPSCWIVYLKNDFC
jgi:hypothetical protein